MFTYLSGSIGIFSSLYLDFHRTSFQQVAVESHPFRTEKLFFSREDYRKIKWVEDKREFEWNNKLYDVSTIEKKQDGFEISCVNDSLEESLIAMVDQWKKDTAPGGKTKTMFQPQFCNSLNGEINPYFTFQNNFFHNSSRYSQPEAQTLSPPPEFLL